MLLESNASSMKIIIFPACAIPLLKVESQDDGSAKESWDRHIMPEEVVRTMQKEAPGWHEVIPALMKTAPKGSIIHWKLMWRDLNPQWTSPGGRIVQVGDSAHTFLPTSGNGATQAMEDATTLATCLQLAGKSNAALGTRIFNKLRYASSNIHVRQDIFSLSS